MCCNPKLLAERMKRLEELGYASPPPEGFAIWRVDPEKYVPSDGAGDLSDAAHAHGGELYECEPSPPMVAIAPNCDCWSAQDKAPCLLHIDCKTRATRQVPVPHPHGNCSNLIGNITGPAIVTAPDGAVWCSLLAGNGALVRVDPATHERTLYEFEAPSWVSSQRIIHIAFHTLAECHHPFRNRSIRMTNINLMFVITSNLVDDDAINMVQCISFYGDSWTELFHLRSIPLPTQDCCCHRIVVVSDGVHPQNDSIIVSELSSSK